MSAPQVSSDIAVRLHGAGLMLTLSGSVVASIRRQAREVSAGDSVAEREVGGLLLGTASASGWSIVEAVGATCEHRWGRALLFSQYDRAVLGSVVAAIRSRQSQQILGFYRTHRRTGPLLAGDDTSLLSGLSVILIIDAESPAGETVHVFTKVDGLADWTSTGQFPLPAEKTAAQEELASKSTLELPGAKIQKAALPRVRAWSAALGIALTVLVGLAVYLRHSPPSAAITAVPQVSYSVPAQLSLNVTLEDDSLRLTWDRNSPVIERAARGHVVIESGELRRDIEIGSSNLRSGSLLYQSAARDVSFRLEVFDPEGASVSETRRYSGVDRGVPTTALLRSPTASRPQAMASPPGEASRQGAPTRGPAPLGAFAPAALTATSAAHPAVLASPLKRASPRLGSAMGGNVPTPSAHGVGIPATPQATELPPGAVPEGSSVAPQPAGQPSPGVEDRSLTAAGTAPPTVTEPPRLRLPAGVRPEAAQVQVPPSAMTPAMAIQQVRPSLPALVKSMIGRDLTVTVKLAVDETGRVVSAAPEDASGATARLLSTYALSAARMWRFKPATLDGRPISSSVSVAFHFSRNQ